MESEEKETYQDQKHPLHLWNEGEVVLCLNMIYCVTATGTGSLVFIDDLAVDGRSRINSEVYRNIYLRRLRSNQIPLNTLDRTSPCRTKTSNTLLKHAFQRPNWEYSWLGM